ncbi:sigma-E factor negative regulatory protein [Marinomonas balearica]|uniref:Sigma-E factor negative regulatory protein RseA n=1 Tax=Marinomonas balearica TaxID=491947 RepID=A0A4R6MI09_9GAMM|nr:hypothetical protein [Marinomonas balearica]TDP00491.1 sigma-E factor negative regulatory protein RseA [Marinomonas balearica]
MKDQSKHTGMQNTDLKNNELQSTELPEVLSAFMDSELSADELDRLLEKDASQWASDFDRLHRVNHAIHHEASPLEIDTQSFLQSMHNKMAQEEASVAHAENVVPIPEASKVRNLSEPSTKNTGARKPTWLFGGAVFGGALAASVAFVVVLGGNLLLDNGVGKDQGVEQVANNLDVNSQIAPIESLKNNSGLENNERLQEYLKRHAEQSALTSGQGMMPMARVVSYPAPSSTQEK